MCPVSHTSKGPSGRLVKTMDKEAKDLIRSGKDGVKFSLTPFEKIELKHLNGEEVRLRDVDNLSDEAEIDQAGLKYVFGVGNWRDRPSNW